jgi:hypothetical protein
MKREDPYHTLGLQWGDGATSSEIKQAFRERARLLHPDVNTTDSPQLAQEKFQQLTKAYETLMKTTTTAGGIVESSMDTEEWRFHVWRQGDRIAIDRDDVAGVKRKRPIQPAATTKSWAAGQLGHPDGRGVVGAGRAEYIGAGSHNNTKRASSVGRGQSKWVQPKKFTPWNPQPEKDEFKAKNARASSTTITSTSSSEKKEMARDGKKLGTRT